MSSRPKIQFDELIDYLKSKPEGLRAFGRRASIDKMTLHRLLTGKMKRFDAALVQRIATYTENRVGHSEFAAFLERLSSKQKRAAA